jgi:transcriptional regulator with XRE-family HTH domain
MQLTDNANNPTLLRNSLQARGYDIMKFAEKLRALRRARQISQRALAIAVGVDHTYLSKIENAKLNFGDYPSEELICKLAEALGADPNELLLLAEKIPPAIKQRVMERPEVFLKLATLDDVTLDAFLVRLGGGASPKKRMEPKSKAR